MGRIRVAILAASIMSLLVAPMQAQQLYSAQATLAADLTFIDRVKIAAVQYAINDVSVESSQTANHDARIALALKVVQSPDAWAKLLAVGVVADLTFSGSTSDAAIFSRVGFIWNTYAGS